MEQNKTYRISTRSGNTIFDGMYVDGNTVWSSEQDKKTADYFSHLLTTAWLMQHILERLRGTPYDKQQLRMTLNRFLPELEKVTYNEFVQLVDNKPEGREQAAAVWKIQQEQEEFMMQVARYRATDYPVLTHIFNMYCENPEKVLEALDIKVEKVYP